MCCKGNSTGTWEELLCFHRDLPTHQAGPCAITKLATKGIVFPVGWLYIPVPKLARLKENKDLSKGRCNWVHHHHLLPLHTVYLLEPWMKSIWSSGSGEEQRKRRIVRTQGVVLPSSGSSLPLKYTRLQLPWQDIELREHSTAADTKETEQPAVLLIHVLYIWLWHTEVWIDLPTGQNGQWFFH